MNRHDFGTWGIDLDADDFARALAAYGVLQASGRFYPPLAPGIGSQAVSEEYANRLQFLLQGEPAARREPVRWLLPLGEPTLVAREHAGALASAWERARIQAGRPLRAETISSWRESTIDPVWTVEQLSRPAVGFASVYLDASGPSSRLARTEWTWPLDIGLLPDDASRRLGEILRADRWVDDLVDIAEIGSGHETCDLLILPFGLREAVIQILQTPVRASCVLLLGGPGEPWERARPMLETIEAHARSSGMAILRVPEAYWGEWFHELVRFLSHDDENGAGLDVALRQAAAAYLYDGRVGEYVTGMIPAPLLIADRRLLDRSRISAVAATLGEQVAAAEAAGSDVDWQAVISAAAEATPGVDPSLMAGVAPEETLRSLLPFDQESNGASVVAAVGRRMRAEPAPARPRRFVQARVHEASTPDAPLTSAFRANAAHQVVVRVGPEDTTWIAATAPFPDEALPEQEEPHRLQVVFTDLRLEREPQTGKIELPREGPSSEIAFALQTGDAGERVEARIIVLHRNRILQTMLLRGEVVADPAAQAAAAPIEIVPEVMVRAHLEDLAGRSRFDAALVLNHTENGQPLVTQIAGERVEVRFKPVDLDKAVALLRRKLDVFIDDPADTVDLESKPMRDLLIALARQGVFFYKTIVRDWDGQSIAEADRIQVVAADPDAYLPIEFVYDRVAPRKNARLCPRARRALEQGQCADECPKGADQARVVCPLGFWCLTKIIERHGHTKARTRDVAWDYDLYSEPTGARRWLGPFGATSFAASSKVDDLRVGRSAELLKELRVSTGATVSQARTWVKWTSDIEKLNPSLLVLLPHTLSEEGEEFLEIGKRAQLGAVEIEAYHVHSAESTTRPIVFLLGCETGDPELAFQKFPTAFRQGGAAIVLATLTPVFGHHAAPVAARIVTALVKQSTQQGITFGEVMLDVRRQLVLEGLPVVLALTAYGDADWRLGVQPGSPEGRTAHVYR